VIFAKDKRTSLFQTLIYGPKKFIKLAPEVKSESGVVVFTQKLSVDLGDPVDGLGSLDGAVRGRISEK
jgi:hypothetical protein